jgi:hypothetical protein
MTLLLEHAAFRIGLTRLTKAEYTVNEFLYALYTISALENPLFNNRSIFREE